jgi:hypothetical protein
MGWATDRLRQAYRRVRWAAKQVLRPPGRGPYLVTGRSRPSLEIHVPIRPTPTFLNMVRCLALSLRRNGGAYRDAPIIATVGDRSVDPNLAERLPWLDSCGVELSWASADDFVRDSYFATGHQRLCYDHAADVVLLMDADILIARPFDEMIESVFEQNVIAGLIAHVSPFEQAKRDDLDWHGLWRHCGLSRPRLEYEHTGWGYMSTDERHRYCPAYFNYGVVAMPRDFARRLGDVIAQIFAKVRERVGTVYDAQIALAVAIAQLSLPARALPMHYNFPNVPQLEALHAAEFPHASILHLLGQHQMTKSGLYASLDAMREFACALHLRVTNAKAQRVIREILPLLERTPPVRAGMRIPAIERHTPALTGGVPQE